MERDTRPGRVKEGSEDTQQNRRSKRKHEKRTPTQTHTQTQTRKNIQNNIQNTTVSFSCLMNLPSFEVKKHTRRMKGTDCPTKKTKKEEMDGMCGKRMERGKRTPLDEVRFIKSICAGGLGNRFANWHASTQIRSCSFGEYFERNFWRQKFLTFCHGLFPGF